MLSGSSPTATRRIRIRSHAASDRIAPQYTRAGHRNSKNIHFFHTCTTPRGAVQADDARCGLSVLLLARRVGAGASVGVELDLADANNLGGHLDTLVFAGELEALFERELARRGHALEHV